MKIAIMQPYFFPYIGYFQLINAVDKFVILDNVNYINKGWINRNRMLVNGEAKYFTIPLKKASQNKLILEIKTNINEESNNKFFKTLLYNYKNAPFFEYTMNIIKKSIEYKNEFISEIATYSLKEVCNYLDIKTEFLYSSRIEINPELKGQDRILAICKELGAEEYYNLSGGIDIYNPSFFDNNKIKLNFIKTDYFEYNQLDNHFIPYLSIIDVMMFNSKEQIKIFLNKFSIIN